MDVCAVGKFNLNEPAQHAFHYRAKVENFCHLPKKHPALSATKNHASAPMLPFGRYHNPCCLLLLHSRNYEHKQLVNLSTCFFASSRELLVN